MSKEIDYGFYALYIGCGYKSLDDKIPDGTVTGFSVHKEAGVEFADITFVDNGEEITIPTNCFDEIKLKLRPFDTITEDEWGEVWGRIGGTPHLYVYGIEELKQLLNGETPEQFGLTMDYFTMTQLINYLRSIHIDCDCLIEAGLATPLNSQP